MTQQLNNSITVVNALSVDVEEYYHATIFQKATRGVPSQHLQSRVERSVDRILSILDQAHAHATFFILGEVAALHPHMVKKITAAKHEVACHGYSHDLVSSLSPDEFRADIRRAKAVLEDTTGQSVLGYRAPSFSIGREQTWAYEVLVQEGFRYDSSLYPIRHDHYGDPAAPRYAFELRRNGSGTLTEIPIGTARVFGMNLPLGGGGYFRLLPSGLIRRGIAWVNRREQQPVVFYFHPWELDPGQPRARMALRHRFRHYVGLRRMEGKLSSLLRHTRFSTIRDVFHLDQSESESTPRFAPCA
jgi:polysaccharide deacetylase family protein (PEP-CTERM system associated)